MNYEITLMLHLGSAASLVLFLRLPTQIVD